MGNVPGRLLALPVLLFSFAAAQVAPPPPDKVPDAFPKDVPVYKDSIIRDYSPLLHNNPKLGMMLVLETTHTEEDVLAFYRHELPANGWKLKKQSSKTPELLEATKDHRLARVTLLAARQAPNPSTLIQLRIIGK
jgi:hypothetical protein